MKIQPIVEHEPATNGWRGDPSPRTKWVRKTTLSWGSGVGTICPAFGSRCAISAAKYPASRNFLMFSSVTEETIHLPHAPNMLGVVLIRRMRVWALEPECAGMDKREGRRRG